MLRSVLSATFLLCFAHAAAAQPYIPQPLSTPPTASLCQAFQSSDAGVVVGDCLTGGVNRAVVWTNGIPALLPLPPGYDRSQAISVNEAGAIAGICGESGTLRNNACLWTNGSVTPLQTPLGAASGAVAINESGVVAGNVDGQATVWTSGVPQTIGVAGPSSAMAMNDRGDVAVVFGTESGVWHVATSTVSALTAPSGTTGSVIATGINNEGNVSGYAALASGFRAIRWIGGVPEVLDAAVSGIANSFATGINDDDEVNGNVVFTNAQMRAAVWRDGPVTLVGEHRSFSYSINGDGIVAGAVSGVAHLFVPADQVALQIVDLVEELVTNGDLDPNDARALQSQLEAAAARLAAGDTTAAIRIVRAFNSRIAGLVRSARLSEEDAEQLLDAANDLIGGLEGT